MDESSTLVLEQSFCYPVFHYSCCCWLWHKWLINTQALSLYIDYCYYGRWVSSVLNLLHYNVLGGGESHLYGTEGPLFYLRNGFNNFNFCFVLALLFLAIFPIARKKYAPELLVVVSPLYIWLGFMSWQPHKEERFGLYYPWICVFRCVICMLYANRCEQWDLWLLYYSFLFLFFSFTRIWKTGAVAFILTRLMKKFEKHRGLRKNKYL